MPNVKQFGYKIGRQINNTSLVVDQNNYASKFVNAYIVYHLDNWPKTLRNKFTVKIWLFGATIVVRSSDKSKYVYSGYEIAFD